MESLEFSAHLPVALRLGLCAVAVACSPDSGLKVTNNAPEAAILSHNDGDSLLEDALVTFQGRGSDIDDRATALEAASWANG